MDNLRVYLAGHTIEEDYRLTCHVRYGKKLDLVDPLKLVEYNWNEIKEKFKDNFDIYAVRRDKKLILSCDILVAYVLKATFGTVMEMIFAFENGIPVYLIDPTKIVRNDPWVKFHIRKSFNTIDECMRDIISVKNI